LVFNSDVLTNTKNKLSDVNATIQTDTSRTVSTLRGRALSRYRTRYLGLQPSIKHLSASTVPETRALSLQKHLYACYKSRRRVGRKVRGPVWADVSPLGRKLDTPIYAVNCDLASNAPVVRTVIVLLPSNEVPMFIFEPQF
jgi:hypothetical protein